MRRRFFTLDVFTEARFAGNPLAVVIEAGGLRTPLMQAIAREFNHPETVFVLPPQNPAHRARLRIFTPAAELPFAGHPTVGTAVLLALLEGARTARDLVVEEEVGAVACRFEPRDSERGRARFSVPNLPQRVGDLPPAADLAMALGVSAGDLGTDGLAAARWSAGLPFCFVPMRTRDAVARCRPDPAHFEQVFGIGGPGKVFVFCRETTDRGIAFHARMFAPGMGIPEDPATGSAAAAFAGLLHASGTCQDGDHRVGIAQGIEMGRPSLIEVGFTIRGGQLMSVAIGGTAVVVTEGAIEA
ncbi:MAG: PhzF family phenazine biosynthesis protein [Pseudorhodoplanes sp.]|nr:PhzF family phenazine biosynthesis protein [Pseudorhodoplanes sp.]